LTVLQVGSALPMLAMFLGLCIMARRYFDRRSAWGMGLGRPRQGWPLALVGGTLAGGVPVAAVVGILALAGAFSSWSVQTSMMTWLLVPTLIIMAFNEEITCRGYLLQTFVDEGRPLLGVLVSSLIFWVFHALNPAVWSTPLASVNLFGAGIVLALAYLATGNIWFPTVMHFAWNAVQGVLFELPVSGVATDGVIDLVSTGAVSGWLSGGDFGLEGSVLITASEILLGVGFFLWWRKNHTHTVAPEPTAVE
jgi:membrane protease YdiL (CAAX protease family)